MILCRFIWIENSNLKQDLSTMEAEKQDAACITVPDVSIFWLPVGMLQ